MENHSLIFQRPPVFDIHELERIEEAALRILEEVGIAILDQEIFHQLRSCGFQAVGRRILVDWHPKLFDRNFFAAWEGEGAKTNRQKAHATIRKLLSQHEYELQGELRDELDRILAKARARFSGI